MHHTQRASLPVLYHSQNLSITLRLPTQRHPDTLPRLPGPALDSHQYKCRISSYGQQPACSVAEYLFRISSVKPDISHHRNKQRPVSAGNLTKRTGIYQRNDKRMPESGRKSLRVFKQRQNTHHRHQQRPGRKNLGQHQRSRIILFQQQPGTT